MDLHVRVVLGHRDSACLDPGMPGADIMVGVGKPRTGITVDMGAQTPRTVAFCCRPTVLVLEQEFQDQIC